MSYQAAVITISDKGSRGERKDTSGPAICEILRENGLTVVYTAIVPDEMEQIQAQLIHCADDLKAHLVLTTGGTGFSPRDVTPEATKAVIERDVPGIPEAMRAESMKITSHGCLSRGIAGIRGGSLIVNLPGSEKAVRENLLSVMESLSHGLDMLTSAGSADCAENSHHHHHHAEHAPSIDQWLKAAKADPSAADCGMYLVHNGTVRLTAKARVRSGEDVPDVTGMDFDYDAAKVDAAVENAKKLPGIGYVRVWLNRGHLRVGDDIMLVLVGGDIRPHVIDALQSLVGEIKSHCVVEKELH